MVNTVVTTGGNIFMLGFISWRLSIFFFIMIPLQYYANKFYSKICKGFKESREAYRGKSRDLHEKFGAMQVIKTFCTEAFELENYCNAVKDKFDLYLKGEYFNSSFNCLSQILPNLATVLTLYYGGTLILNGE